MSAQAGTLKRASELLRMRVEAISGGNTADLGEIWQPHEELPVDLGEIAAWTISPMTSNRLI